MKKRTTILGVGIDSATRRDISRTLDRFLDSDRPHHIVTPNPEFVLAAQRDERFRRILNEASLSVPDGFGLMLAARAVRQPLASRFPGTDLVGELARLASERKKTLYLLGARGRTAANTARRIMELYPGVNIVGAHPFERPNGSRLPNTTIVDRINRRRPDILLVAHGAPKQEYWIDQYLPQLSSVRIAMGVGGAFDYLSGQIARAPSFLRAAGLEWLYRVIRQPRRLPRIVNATIIFPAHVARTHLFSSQK